MTMQVDKARLDEMIAGLEGVTPGPWFDWEAMEWLVEPKHLMSSAAAALIARCDPDTMRSIITELLELRSLRSTEGKDGAKTVAYLIDCPVEPCLEFADVDVPDAAIPLVRRSDLEAAEASHKAARENFLTMQGSAAQLLTRAEAAEAHVAKLERERQGALWMPIESAPKEGARIDLWREYNQMRLTDAYWSDGKWQWENYRYDEPDDQITHWQPLPPPPAKEPQ